LRNRARYDPHAEITFEGAKGVIHLASPLTKTDPFMLVRNDPWNAQLIGWWFLI